MNDIVNFIAVRKIIANSMKELQFGKAFGLAFKFTKDNDLSLSICTGEKKIMDDGSVCDCQDDEINNIFKSLLGDYKDVVLDESGYFYKLHSIEDNSFLSSDLLCLIGGWGLSIIPSNSIDSEKKRVIGEQSERLCSHDAFIVFKNKVIFLDKFDKPVDKRFTHFCDGTNDFLSKILPE